ncbi:unnamed protein product, partial [marine sediment metagenome]
MKDLISPHTRGESIYVDDIPEPVNLLYAAVYASNIPHGKIISLDIIKAENSEGVCKVLIAKDIPGNNQIGRLIQDEELLAEKEVL